MKISRELPPNYDELKEKFEFDLTTAVFTHGETIYCPGGGWVDPSLIAHEELHMLQQDEMGGPSNWWRKWIDDPKFRMEQELAAYRLQYKNICLNVSDRELVTKCLHSFALDLASPQYGEVITYGEAFRLLRNPHLPYEHKEGAMIK